MITTVTMNPCIDRMVTIESFTYGGMNRILDSRIDASGKGINVAIAYTQLGGRALCTGINYRERVNLIVELLDGKGIEHDFVNVDGEVRINHKIYDRSKQVVTELNESGYPIDTLALEKVKEKVITHSSNSEILVISGSIPKGVPDTIYKDLLKAVSHLPVKTILDAEVSLLLECIKENPNIIKPNLFELESSFNIKITSHREILKAAVFFWTKEWRL